MLSPVLERFASLCFPRLLTGLLLTLCLAAPQPATACGGTPAPFCGKTLVLSQAGPSVILLPGGGSFDIPLTVYFEIFSFPTGAALCPPGPYTADIELTVTCTPSGDGAGTLSAVPLTPGYNDLTVPVTLADGPPRLCAVDGVATATFSDGMVLTATSDSLACIGEPAPGNPALPRLDMELVAGDAVSHVHPGDQSAFIYRITNNDPNESFSGVLEMEMLNSSRLPGMSGPPTPGSNGFAVSDPVAGDNFPIGFLGDLQDGCLPLPPDPTDPTIPLEQLPIALGPGDFIEVDAFARPWGMCADGSCGRAKVTLDGLFAGSDPGIACSGFVSAADTAVPPQFLWPDAGSALFFQPPPDPFLGLLPAFGEFAAGAGIQMDILTLPPQLIVDGQPLPVPPQMIAEPPMDTFGRANARFEDKQGLFGVDSFFDITYRIEFAPAQGEPFEFQLMDVQLIPGAPTDFEQLAPFAVVQLGIVPQGQPEPNGFLQLMPQISGLAFDDLGQAHPVGFGQVLIAPSAGGLDLSLQAFIQAPRQGGELGSTIVSVDLFQDFRGHLAEALELPCPDCDVFFDGFELGTTAAWSNSVP